MRSLCFIATIGLFLGLIGCGDGIKRVPVQGKLTAKGQPVDNAVVMFIPTGTTKGEGGIGQSDRDGNFTLSGLKGVKGLTAGEYKVRVNRFLKPDGTPLPPDAPEADNPGARETVPPPYSSADSTLKATVPDAGGTVNIDLPTKLTGRK